ncbi:hypothetical protein VR010_03880 [Actinomycetaceae bacterium L2_0104]
MDDEIQLFSDGDGIAIFGEASAVDRFLASEGLTAQELDVQRLGATFSAAAAVTQAGSEMAANSGRWMKLTQESAQVAEKFPLVKNSKTGYSHATARAKNGQFVKNLQFENGIGTLATNPAILTGVAGIMAQMAMQQAINEITDYLSKIDKKVDDLLRNQKDVVLADMIGVELVVDETMTVREHVGHVSKVTWSKVQASSMTIAQTQAYALRQLKSFAEKLENTSDVDDLADMAKEIEPKVQEWLAVLARCFQLQEATAMLELDRVLETSPEELDDHRLGLRSARQRRLQAITQTTNHLLSRIEAAAQIANTKVLMNPFSSRNVVNSSNQLAGDVIDFQCRLGIENSHEELVAKKWTEAATTLRDKVIDAGAERLDAAKQLSSGALLTAKTKTNKLSRGFRAFRDVIKDDGEPVDQETKSQNPEHRETTLLKDPNQQENEE